MATMEAIKTIYLESDEASVTFASIPQTYKHLQLRGTHRCTHAVGGLALWIRLGGNGSIQTSADYHSHMCWAFSSSVYASTQASQTRFHLYDAMMGVGATGASTGAHEYGSFMFDVCDYTVTGHDTTVSYISCASLTHNDKRLLYGTGYWAKSYAVTDIQILPSAGNMIRGSEYTLYGIKSS